MPYPGETFINAFGSTLSIVADELRQYYALVQGYLSTEHRDDGTHGNITAQSVTSTGAVTGGAAGTFVGDVVASNGTGAECGIGTLATVNGTALESGELVRKGLLLGGVTNGVWIEQRAFASPFTSGTSELRLWLLPWDSTTAAIRFGIISSVPTLMDGGTGSTAINLGTTTRPLNNVYATQYFRANYTAAQGEWTDVTFAAGNFTASTGNWTLQSGDQVTFAYTLVGKTMTVVFEFDGTDTSAITAQLLVAIPGGFAAAKKTRAIIQTIDNGGAAQAGVAFVNASSSQIVFQSTVAGGGWANTGGAANNTYVRGQIVFPVQ